MQSQFPRNQVWLPSEQGVFILKTDACFRILPGGGQRERVPSRQGRAEGSLQLPP